MISFSGERSAIEPLVVVMRSSCSGIVACAASSGAEGVAGRKVGGVVRGRRVMDVGRWPPRENVVRWRRAWPPRDFGSIPSTLA